MHVTYPIVNNFEIEDLSQKVIMELNDLLLLPF